MGSIGWAQDRFCNRFFCESTWWKMLFCSAEATLMAWGCVLWTVLVVASVYSCSASPAQPSAIQQIPPKAASVADPNVTEFLPAPAKLVKELRADFDHDGTIAIVLAYASDTVPAVTTGVRVLKYGTHGWAVAFEEADSVINGAGAPDAINIEKVRSSSGKEGIVVVLRTS